LLFLLTQQETAMKYTKKQALFAKIYLLTGDTKRAYREAGYKSRRAPTKLLKSPGVEAALEELRIKQERYVQKHEKKSPAKRDISRDDVLFSLAELRERATKKGNYQTALKAITEISRLLGFYDKPPRHENKNKEKHNEAPVNLSLRTKNKDAGN
jgi:hypothetical protein